MGEPAPGEAGGAGHSVGHGLSRLAGRVKLPIPALRGFLIATLVTSIGTSMYMTVSIVYFVRSLHLSAGFVGAGLTIAAAFGLAASLPAGRFADKHGAKPVLVVLFAIQAVLFGLFPLVSGPAEFLVAVVFISAAASASFPVSQVLISDLAGGASRVAAEAYNRSVLNVGMSIGALFASAALAVDTRSAYDVMLLGNAVSFVGAGVLLSRINVPARTHHAAGMAPAAAGAPGRHPLRQPRFVAAGVICGVLYLSASILDVALPLQVSQHTVAPRWMIAALLLLNTVLAVALQVRASAGSETVPGAARANRLAGIALIAACALFPASAATHTVAVAIIALIAATVMLTAGELFSSAGTWGLSYGLSPAGQQGRYLASFGLLSRMVTIVGPALAAGVVNAGLPGWLAAGTVFLGVGLAAPFVSRTSQEPAEHPGAVMPGELASEGPDTEPGPAV